MRLLCDEMLQGLGRWLRAAGYDTLVESRATPDRVLLARAVRERRHLITRDRKLVEHRAAAGTVVLLTGNSVDACAEELGGILPIDWLHRPFSRCTVCNTLLTPVPLHRRHELPSDVRGRAEPAVSCACCGRLYWEGAHVTRMRGRLAHWSRGGQAARVRP